MPQTEHGRAARLLTARTYLGLNRDELAQTLNVRAGTMQSWENGRAPIPTGLWSDITRLFEEFEKDVAAVLDQAAASDDDQVRVRVWRKANAQTPFPGWRMRVVSEAMRRDPRIEPTFAEDDTPR